MEILVTILEVCKFLWHMNHVMRKNPSSWGGEEKKAYMIREEGVEA